MQKLLMLQAYIAHLQVLQSNDYKDVESDEDGISVEAGEGTTVHIQFGDEGYLYKVWVDGQAADFGNWYKTQKGWEPLETVSQLKKLIWK